MNLPKDPPRNLYEACRIPAYATALSQLIYRVPGADVADELVHSGLDSADAVQVVKNAKRLLDDAVSGPGNLLIGTGTFFLIAGVIVTAFTMITAFESGGFYVVWYGAIIWGVLSIGRGLSMNRAPDMSAVHSQLDAAMEAARQDSDLASTEPTPRPASGQYDY